MVSRTAAGDYKICEEWLGNLHAVLYVELPTSIIREEARKRQKASLEKSVRWSILTDSLPYCRASCSGSFSGIYQRAISWPGLHVAHAKNMHQIDSDRVSRMPYYVSQIGDITSRRLEGLVSSCHH
jgi:hypothetical protein